MAKKKAAAKAKRTQAATPDDAKIQRVPIESVTPDPANVRRHPDRNIDAIMGSLQRFGQQRPILVSEKGVVIAGNGTLAAAKRLGWTDILIQRSNLVGAEAMAYAIADNRTAELAEWDEEALAAQLRAIEGEDAALAAAIGFDELQLRALVDGEAINPASEWSEANMPQSEQEDLTAFQRIIIHFANPDDRDKFAKLVQQKITDSTKYIWYPRQDKVVARDKAYV